MHPLSFQWKRAHLSAVAFGRRLFRGTKRPDEDGFDGVLDMTPARFDILALVHGSQPHSQRLLWSGRLAMAEITRNLGLSRPTISKAVKRLVELGLVTTEPLDRRSKVVCLTAEGVRRIRQALHLIFSGRALSRHIRRFFFDEVGTPRKRAAAKIGELIEETWWQTRRLGCHLGDTSEAVYIPRGFD
jgi:DNA-binding MarR family transcriptional regulator